MIPRVSHWSPRYALDRIRLLAFTLTHPNAPWLAPGAVRFLDRWLQPHHVGFEWGAGRGTIWFSQRVERLTSIEHDPAWHARVQQTLLAQPRNNVDLRECAVDCSHSSHSSHSSHNSHRTRYVNAINDIPDASLDFVLVDGISDLRDACALAAIPKIRPGGALIIDDIHRYLPSNSRAPLALPPNAEPLTPIWNAVTVQIESWDYQNSTSGVTDTGIWIKQ
jgi:hypothetical protein